MQKVVLFKDRKYFCNLSKSSFFKLKKEVIYRNDSNNQLKLKNTQSEAGNEQFFDLE